MNGWTPRDEIAFMEGLTRPIPEGERDHCGPMRPLTREQRLQALKNAVRLLPVRSFPGWSAEQIGHVISEGQKILKRELDYEERKAKENVR
jgi:hypothetical protein